uniref:Uncharacterized protein n=1 Tax=Physcomitrium patens TaxID=3218 RepID=A0A2K1IQL4_PHYPA|nr:hypothetical protein PHYPA_025687 [Physcomitrium patens]
MSIVASAGCGFGRWTGWSSRHHIQSNGLISLDLCFKAQFLFPDGHWQLLFSRVDVLSTMAAAMSGKVCFASKSLPTAAVAFHTEDRNFILEASSSEC